jgi:nicotinate-nucleotide adenylyltransferase
VRLALFGGTFDPVHYGHLRCAASVREEFSLDRILLIPSRSPVHKDSAGASGEDRARMIELALPEFPGLELSRIELERDAPSYSVFTAREIISANPGAELFFMLGMDAFNTLRTWRECDELGRLVTFIVMVRGGEEADRELVSRYRVLFSRNERIDMSSTLVREKIRGDDSLDGILPGVVHRYIREKRLYASVKS